VPVAPGRRGRKRRSVIPFASGAECLPRREPADHKPQGEAMDPVTRRSFLIKGSAGAVGAAGLAAGGFALSSIGDNEPALSASELEELDGPVVLQITDPAAGEVEVLFGEREVAFTDKSLVARVLRSAR
jgi:hypothetical protein